MNKQEFLEKLQEINKDFTWTNTPSYEKRVNSLLDQFDPDYPQKEGSYPLEVCSSLDLYRMEDILKPFGVEKILFPSFHWEKVPQTSSLEHFSLVLRPSGFLIKKNEKYEEVPITFKFLKELFGSENVGGMGQFLYDQSWYESESFFTEELKGGVFLITGEVIRNSTNKTWSEQEELILKGTRRRTLVESVWDTLFFQLVYKKRVLEYTYDWTSTKASVVDLVVFGLTDSDGANLSYWRPDYSNSRLGVCMSRELELG